MNSGHTPNNLEKPLARSLLVLRLGIFVVMLLWTIDKFVNPTHNTGILSGFYGIDWLSHSSSYIIGGLELILVIAFVCGLYRRWTYGTVLVIHAMSTFISYKQYLSPFDHMLFFTAWPMLAACLALYWLRDWDNLLAFAQRKKTNA
ncbi:MauE/DoxX family redox-associated membrane protein [Gilvimarinus polysaccharolyticus]|uniref:MauE/DoxX family redox-associated membrane protein n=1 Tax=Gilvimarinus polysaccharolyticus TaxID=863921 RepID=UPI000673B060|nr:MauE/DoxX family redox-associated membrane protein [Gilvimarinus polysaccharolyticus]